jgi:hypothetical protein
VVIVAPHGGRRRRSVRRDDGINDLYTAELARQLADQLDAYAVVNHTLDRNDVDLNRISQLIVSGSPMLAALESAIMSAAEDGAVPLILLIHGWNVALEWCDIGIGTSDIDGVLAGRYPTVARACFDEFLQPLRTALETCGIGATFGHRYPAVGRDNATQMFSARHVDHEDAAVRKFAERAADGRVDAVQLELGISLRWPGPRRDEFVHALARCVDEYVAGRAGNRKGVAASAHIRPRSGDWSLPARKKDPAAARPERGYSVQVAMEDGGGLFFGIEAAGAKSMASRICMARPDGKLLLFVGEGAWPGRMGHYELGGLRWAVEEAAENPRRDWPAVARLSFEGPVVAYPSHDAFVDLEQGLSRAELVDCRLELTVEYDGDSFGNIEGVVDVGGHASHLRTTGVCERGSRADLGASRRGRVALTSGLEVPLHADVDLPGDTAAVSTKSEDMTDWLDAFELRARSGEHFHAAATLRVPVYRPQPDGSAIKVTFGVVAAGVPGAESKEIRGVFETVEHIPYIPR